MATVRNFCFPLILVAALGCGLNTGVFFAFSTFVMPALARLKPSQEIAAMQSINITAINPLFILALFGTAFACLFLAIALFIGQMGSQHLITLAPTEFFTTFLIQFLLSAIRQS